jgi:hypothetical protein
VVAPLAIATTAPSTIKVVVVASATALLTFKLKLTPSTAAVTASVARLLNCLLEQNS